MSKSILQKTVIQLSKINYSKSAFTLAEVLITIGIIGVVAALTIPNLISSYNNHVVETRLKKFYSAFNQAIQRSVADNGDYMEWNDYFFGGGGTDADGNVIDRYDENDAAFQKYLAPYIKIVETRDIEIDGYRYKFYFLSDGSSFHYAFHENRDISFYPKNLEKCLKKSSPIGVCGFVFSFYPLANNTRWQWHYKKPLEPNMYNWSGKQDDLYSGCKNNGIYCTAIIEKNGWKVPKDYPRKISF